MNSSTENKFKITSTVIEDELPFRKNGIKDSIAKEIIDNLFLIM